MSTEADNVVQMPERPERTQLVFELEGFPDPTGLYFNLASAKNLPTDKTLGWEQHVSGRFEGTLTGTEFMRRQGELVQVWKITVLEATLD